MKKKLFLVCAALMCTVALMAQNISVVSSGGSTKLYRTLQAAIEGADPNSVIYLPGGGFPIADNVKITKKLTIIGIGHKAKNDNVDGVTTISGNLFFNEGSSGSAVMACYITGDVNIGEGGASVNDVLIRYCNLNSVQVNNSTCQETVVNQNYIRETSRFGNSNVKITNCVLKGFFNIDGGEFKYNNLTAPTWSDAYTGSFNSVYNTIITNNLLNCVWLDNWRQFRGSNNHFSDNFVAINQYLGDNVIILDSLSSLTDLYENWNNGAITPTSDFHFKEEYKQYENQFGIYAGDGFNDKQLAPVPFIVAKKIDEQTDASGKLNVKIRVKAGE